MQTAAKGCQNQDSLHSELKSLREFFKKYDRNKDGQLDRAELKEAFKYLGALIPVWRAYWALHHADADGDGRISEKEMKDLVAYAAKLGFTVK